jgi:hypothetical protein
MAIVRREQSQGKGTQTQEKSFVVANEDKVMMMNGISCDLVVHAKNLIFQPKFSFSPTHNS